MNSDSKSFMLMINQVLEIFFYFIDNEYGGPYFSCTMAGWAIFCYGDGKFRFNTLACYLHQSKLGDGQDCVFGSVLGHEFLHCLVHYFFVLRKFHINEINDNDTSEIPQA